MNVFYTPDITNQPIYTLNEEESKHCIKVLRLAKGQNVYLIDGHGGLFTAQIINPHPKHTELQIISINKEYKKRNHYLHIGIAPTKHIERLEWFAEKATEIGIDEITPVLCERSERKQFNIDRLNKIITTAIKQSIKAYHPKLNALMKFSQFITNTLPTQKFIAHCMEGEKTYLKQEIQPNGHYTIMIGPEGDFTPKELGMALNEHFMPITLGDSRLRTETAALEACFEINFLNR